MTGITTTRPLHRNPGAGGNHVPAYGRQWAFFLDVDGTLLEIAAHPDAVQIAPLLMPALQALGVRTHSPLALVSGRAIADLDRLFAPLQLPAAGQHGAERRDAQGRLHLAASRDARMAYANEMLCEFARGNAGIVIEDKGLTLSVHYRMAPWMAEEVAQRVDRVAAQLGPDFTVQAGSMVREIRRQRHDKGRAIIEFVAEPPFAGRLPVFLGDDVTDEHGFEVVNGLGGHSIKVGSDPTAAHWRLSGVADVIAWLQGYIEAHATIAD